MDHVMSSYDREKHVFLRCSGGGGDGACVTSANDVVFHVGKRRRAYHVSAESLKRGSVHFRNLLHNSAMGGLMAPIVIDCEEAIFESLLALMRYGTFEALPPMPEAEMFKVRREVELYGIQVTESPKPATHSGRSSLSTTPSTSPSGSPKMSSPDDVSGSHGHPTPAAAAVDSRRQLAELPDFPLHLADPAKLVLVSCLDHNKEAIFSCDCTGKPGAGATRSAQWALNFHHRHAFCTACGRPPRMPAKHFAEMFMAAASHYYTQQAGLAKNQAWWVGADSTCTLRFVRSSGGNACSSCSARGAALDETLWAASGFYSHAFCTRCGQSAEGPVLLSLLLALRYGGSNKVAKSSSASVKIRSPPTSG